MVNTMFNFLAAVGIRSGFSAQPDQTAKRDAQRNLKTTLAAVVVGGGFRSVICWWRGRQQRQEGWRVLCNGE